MANPRTQLTSMGFHILVSKKSASEKKYEVTRSQIRLGEAPRLLVTNLLFLQSPISPGELRTTLHSGDEGSGEWGQHLEDIWISNGTIWVEVGQERVEISIKYVHSVGSTWPKGGPVES